MDFLVHETEPGAYDEEAKQLGSKIIPCPAPSPLAFAKNFRRVLREHGPYDVVHSHVHAYSGWVLRAAAKEGVPVRVAHSHTDRTNVASEQTLKRRMYRAVMGHLLRRYATAGLGISEAATASFFGDDWRRDPRWRIVYYGMNFSRIRAAGESERSIVRDELGLPRDAMVIGHVGNLLPVKNHRLLLDMTAELSRRRPPGAAPLRLLLIGEGPSRSELQAQATKLGIRELVHFAGARPDVPRMLAAMDVFVFPSLWEGLGLAVVEAQAAGLPLVVSDRVPAEATVVPELVRRLSPDAPAASWADACAAAYESRGAVTKAEALGRVEAGAFNMDTCLREMAALYTGGGHARG
jgi:glycosyltransferase involved in cell wall biosynthesis